MSYRLTKAVARTSRVTKTAKLVAVVMADASDDKSLETFIGQDMIATRTGLTVRAVRKAIAQIVDAGVAVRLSRGNSEGSARYAFDPALLTELPDNTANRNGVPVRTNAESGARRSEPEIRSERTGISFRRTGISFPLSDQLSDQGSDKSYRSEAAVTHSDASVAERTGPLPGGERHGGGGASGGSREFAEKRPRTGRHEIEALVGPDLVAAFEAQASRAYSDAAWREISTQLAYADDPVAAMIDAIERGADWPSAHAPPSIEADATPRAQSANGHVFAADWNIRGAES